MKRLGKVKIEWSSKFAYAIGLIATDGCLSGDGRHIDFTSKDLDLVEVFKRSLVLGNRVGRKSRGREDKKKYFRIQFGDSDFYDFLLSLGLMPAKSKVIKGVKNLPHEYFFHFLRGCFDGDGNINVATHSESKHPQLRIRFFSASPMFLTWLKNEIIYYGNIERGWLSFYAGVHVLTYGKEDSIKLLGLMYSDAKSYYLKRKYEVAKRFLV